MKGLDLNEIPQMLESKKITRKEAVNILAEFVLKNERIFGLSEKDSDFKADVLLMIIESGDHLFKLYNPKLGNFFNYFFSFVRSQIGKEIRKLKRNTYLDLFCLEEQKKLSLENTYNPHPVSERLHEAQKTQPKATKELFIASRKENYNLPRRMVSDEKICQINERLKNFNQKIRVKILMILALKSAYYITDSQIKTISSLCNLNEQEFAATIHNLRNDLDSKIKTRKEYELRRNNAYFHRKRFETLIQNEQKADEETTRYYRLDLQKKYQRHTNIWNKLNKKFSEGFLMLRPTTEVVAKILGIGVRQTNYYWRKARELGLELEE